MKRGTNPYKSDNSVDVREKTIVRTSLIGIAANVFLAAFKAVVGVLSNSIAVILDAVNNLSDALSSVITIIGSKLSSKKPSRRHPLGYGRIEYLSALMVAFIVLYAGITSGVESVKKILHPEIAEYSIVTLVIIGSAVVVKFFLGRFVKAQGEKVNSQALVASGSDASFDAILSLSVFLCALVYMLFGVSLEAFVGAAISIFIIKSGVEMVVETIDDILGQRADSTITRRIKEIAEEIPEVSGAYDLVMNNYGPDRNYASVHIELPDTMLVEEVDRITRHIEEQVYTRTGVILTGIGVYSRNTSDDEASAIRNGVQKIVMEHDFTLQMHGFFVDMEQKSMRFDVVFSFDVDPELGRAIIKKEVQKAYPGYGVFIAADVDISDV